MPFSSEKRRSNRDESEHEQGKQSRPAARRRRFWLLVGVGLVCLFLYNSWGQLAALWDLRQDKQQLEQEVAELEAEREEMKKQVEKMQTDEWIEQAAREELGLVRPGEMLLIPEDSGSQEALDNGESD